MIVLSSGLPKSGSAWVFFMINDLTKASGYSDTLEIKKRFNLEHLLKYKTCNIQNPTSDKLDVLLTPPIGDFTFTVKTHFPPNLELKKYIDTGMIKATFTYRDPRDMAVSVVEAGKKLRAKGNENYFAKIHTLEQGILWAEKWLKKSWDEWKKIDNVHRIRYEDLLEYKGALGELKNIARFLGFQENNQICEQIIKKWGSKEVKNTASKRLHFNRGISKNYLEKMNPDEIEWSNERLGSYIIEMGYHQ